MTHPTAQSLGSLLRLADSGTWGEAAPEGSGDLVLRSSNIAENSLDLTNVARRRVPMKHRQSKRLRDGDIVVVTSSGSPDHIGKCCLFSEDADATPYYFSNFTLRLRPDPSKVHPRWLFYWLTSRRGRALLEGMNPTTSGLRNLNKRLYLEQSIPLRSLAEQSQLTELLEKADAIHRKRRESLRLLDRLQRSTFMEMFGDPGKNEKGWGIGRMGDVISETQYGTSARANSQGNGLPVLRMNNITRSGAIDLREVKWCEISARDFDKYTLRRGDMLFNRTNSPELVGKTAVWDLDEAYAFAGYLIRVRFDDTRALPEYVSGYLNSSYGKQILFEKAKPSINMSNISPTELRRLPIMLPPLDAQARYRELLSKVKVAARQIASAIPVCESLYDSLAHRAFEGNLSETASGNGKLGQSRALSG